MAEDADTASIVSGVIGLAKCLKIEVVAEGVETHAQLELLRRQGCQKAQGYLFSHALPATEFEQFAHAWRGPT